METHLEQNRAHTKRIILAWCVHLYTALGLILAAGMAVSIVRGTPEAFRLALLLMLIATFIDSTDGWLARRAKVKEILPGFDGRRLDDLVDFQNYTSLPLLLLWRAEVFPHEYAWLLLLPLLASAYGFSQTNAKTDDGFFLGFPSYWNVIAFYLYFLRLPLWANALILVGFSILTFVPSVYLYPSQHARFSKLTNVLVSLWAALLVYIILVHPENTRALVLASLILPVYYVIVSWFVTIQRKRQKPDR